jgi:FkbM family methyltransferase
MINVKGVIMGSTLGLLALEVRERIDLLRVWLARDETLGTMLNDSLAGKLIGFTCRPGSTSIDVGAHIGSVISRFLLVNPSGKVIAFEAVPEKAEALRRRFPSVEVHACAVGCRSGRKSFFIDERRSGYSSLDGAWVRHDPVREITVQVRTLDEVVRCDDVDAIKIDVEGAELAVIRGGRRLLEAQRPVVLFESAFAEANGLGFAAGDLWDELDGLGYDIVVPNRLAHDGPSLSREGFVESHAYPRRTTNYFGLPRDKRVEIRDRVRRAMGETRTPR